MIQCEYVACAAWYFDIFVIAVVILSEGFGMATDSYFPRPVY